MPETSEIEITHQCELFRDGSFFRIKHEGKFLGFIEPEYRVEIGQGTWSVFKTFKKQDPRLQL